MRLLIVCGDGEGGGGDNVHSMINVNVKRKRKTGGWRILPFVLFIYYFFVSTVRRNWLMIPNLVCVFLDDILSDGECALCRSVNCSLLLQSCWADLSVSRKYIVRIHLMDQMRSCTDRVRAKRHISLNAIFVLNWKTTNSFPFICFLVFFPPSSSSWNELACVGTWKLRTGRTTTNYYL